MPCLGVGGVVVGWWWGGGGGYARAFALCDRGAAPPASISTLGGCPVCNPPWRPVLFPPSFCLPTLSLPAADGKDLVFSHSSSSESEGSDDDDDDVSGVLEDALGQAVALRIEVPYFSQALTYQWCVTGGGCGVRGCVCVTGGVCGVREGGGGG